VLATRAAEIDPSAPLQLQLAKLLHSMGRLAEAEARYREAIARDPDSEGSRRLLAGLLDAQGKHEEADAQRVAAIEQHQRALARGFAPGKAQLRIGELELERGRPLEAQSHFEAALRLDPQHAAAQRGLERARVEQARRARSEP
jgi:tetratricopeptide (TPR) repeat protein